MSPELDEKLCRRYPLLYRDRHGNPRETPFAFGFECDDGWFELIDGLSKRLERLIEQLPAEDRELCRAAQVKEKRGTLRFYLDDGTDEMFRLIDEAEAQSASVCELCAAPGSMRMLGGWLLKTLCDECHAGRAD